MGWGYLLTDRLPKTHRAKTNKQKNIKWFYPRETNDSSGLS